MKIDANDDMAGAEKPFKVVACMAVLGRLPLLEQTIRRLYTKNGVDKVICVGHVNEDRKVVEAAGGVWVQHMNKPLALKWNAAFVEAKRFNPDAVLYVGSSDFIEDAWLDRMRPFVEQYHFCGVQGCYFIDLGEKKRLVFWPGYAGTRTIRDRDDETIGIGRMLSRDLMEKLKWRPFDSHLDNSLDKSMKTRAAAVGFKDFMVPNLKALSISTDIWWNKHRFEQHWRGDLPSQRINDVDIFLKHFPEIEIVDASIHQREPIRP